MNSAKAWDRGRVRTRSGRPGSIGAPLAAALEQRSIPELGEQPLLEALSTDVRAAPAESAASASP